MDYLQFIWNGTKDAADFLQLPSYLQFNPRSCFIATASSRFGSRRDPLGVSITRHVHEEAHRPVALLSTHVALEDVVAAVVAHVDGVQHGILEEYITVLAFVNRSQWIAGSVVFGFGGGGSGGVGVGGLRAGGGAV